MRGKLPKSKMHWKVGGQFCGVLELSEQTRRYRAYPNVETAEFARIEMEKPRIGAIASGQVSSIYKQ